MLQLIQITDTHFRADPDWLIRGVNPRATLTRVLETARTDIQNSDLILATGDLSDDGSDASYQALNRVFGKLPIPIMPLPGNHDLPERVSACLDASNILHEGYQVYDHWQIITLNSARPNHVGGQLAPDQLLWLQQRLRAEPERHTLIALHHPPVEVGSRWMDEIMLASADELFKILDQHQQVRAVIWGHIHQEYSSLRNNVQLLGTPS
ncbi:MAG TPA: phosphodiesterase, partial [Gammaproteobacteria bacterium]|nr:phosphodiesterase [Gammaproteobacteria bacterium]